MKLKTEVKTTEKIIQKVDKDSKYEGIIEFDTPAYKPRRRKLRDRYDGRYLKDAPPMSKLIDRKSTRLNSSHY